MRLKNAIPPLVLTALWCGTLPACGDKTEEDRRGTATAREAARPDDERESSRGESTAGEGARDQATDGRAGDARTSKDTGQPPAPPAAPLPDLEATRESQAEAARLKAKNASRIHWIRYFEVEEFEEGTHDERMTDYAEFVQAMVSDETVVFFHAGASDLTGVLYSDAMASLSDRRRDLHFVLSTMQDEYVDLHAWLDFAKVIGLQIHPLNPSLAVVTFRRGSPADTLAFTMRESRISLTQSRIDVRGRYSGLRSAEEYVAMIEEWLR